MERCQQQSSTQIQTKSAHMFGGIKSKTTFDLFYLPRCCQGIRTKTNSANSLGVKLWYIFSVLPRPFSKNHTYLIAASALMKTVGHVTISPSHIGVDGYIQRPSGL